MPAIAGLVFAATLALVFWRPRGLPIAWTTTLAASACLALGLVTPGEVVLAARGVWDATLAFVAAVLITLVLDEAGFFAWAALHLARRTRGDARLALAAVVVFSGVVTAVFNNDGAVLILTPIVSGFAERLGLPRPAALALFLAAGFVVDAGSLPFTVSNLVNILAADAFGIGFGTYARIMIPVDLVALSASLLVLVLAFRRALSPRLDVAALPEPASAVRDPVLFRWGWGVLALLAAGYGASQAFGWPASAVAGVGALALLLRAAFRPTVPLGPLVLHAPWRVIVFALGLFVVVYALRGAGLIAWLSASLEAWARRGELALVLGTGVGAALLSSFANNLPATLAHILALQGAALAPGDLRLALLSAVVGCDQGPKMTPIGSLATLLWLETLARRGFRVTWGEYVRAGLLLTPPVLLVTLLSLWAAARLIGPP
ncbi:MAG: arsenical efflux pump membrane protein ArsB [Clostridia bacterium]|nr:arsenical efflux pump membrane protein ArsB [Clostridia bacterium]